MAMAVIGLLGVTAATMFVIKAGGAATATDPDSPPPTRTVIATLGPNTPHASAEIPVPCRRSASLTGQG